MNGYDQVLTVLSIIGLGLMAAAWVNHRALHRLEREIAAEKAGKAHPAE